jgi:hypothetical protein
MITPQTYENHGLIIPEVQENDFIFGDQKLGDFPINPSGDWTQWLPSEENQDVGVEPMACTTFACLNCVETMLRQRYGSTLNYSDRFLAYISGTGKQGNDPHKVAEALRKSGDVLEADYPYTPDQNTWEKFYAKPAKWLYTKYLEFCAEYSFGHSWVTNPTQQRMMDALTYSPLTAGVYAWQFDAVADRYIRPAGMQSTHDVMIYGYLANNYWLCFDSYDQHVKKLAWDFGFDAVKRYTLDRQIATTPESESAWELFKKWFAQVISDLRYGYKPLPSI